MNIKIIAETIFQIEEEMDLFNLKVDDIYFWELVRVNVGHLIAQRSGIYGQAHTKLNKNPVNVGVYLFNAARNIFVKNPFFSPQTDLLFIGHQRRKLLEDGFWWDIYCDPIIQNLKNIKKCLLFEKPYLNKHLSPSKTENIRYLDFSHLGGKILNSIGLNGIAFSRSNERSFNELEKRIESQFAVRINVKEIVCASLSARKTIIPLYIRLLKKIKPKIVIVLVSYGNEALIECSKKLGIPTVELQHGTLSRYHLAYSFPGKKAIKRTFPDYFFTFGDYWKRLVDFPISDGNIINVGYPFFEMETLKYETLPKKNQIVFISQGTIGEEMSKFAVELKKSKELQMDIVYKLHPGEYLRWQEVYPWLVNSGIRILADESEPIYKTLAESKVLIGVYSTLLYEGLGFGIPTFLLDLPGIEYLDDLISSNLVKKIGNKDQLLYELSQLQQNQISRNCFFKSNSLENINMALEEILGIVGKTQN